MFSREGSARSDAQNRILASYLALVGGFVNSSGFVLVGTFTSHVTGNVGRLANDSASGDYAAAMAAFAMILSFFLGALGVSMMIESRFFGRSSRAYATALALEAVLLVVFTLLSYSTVNAHPRLRDSEALLLCAAMGMQNALVTRLSGAVVRTTHLTGVVTDLGIESARWFRYWRGTVSRATGVRLMFGQNPPERPLLPKAQLLSTIAFSFLGGAVLGAALAVKAGHASMLFAASALAAGAIYGFRHRVAPGDPSIERR
jgi:uncharacterized membrane protein YoaK (UPF0700 family)